MSNLPPLKRHFGDRWLISGRVGKIGYIWVRTFNPAKATLGPDRKMTTMLRAALKGLGDTEGLILDLQSNGGGRVSASDPFLGHFLKKRQSYKWGGNARKSRVIRPGRPRYDGRLVAIVDERSASGGEWAARILRDAGRATVIGGTTVGAEAAVHTSTGPDGSVLKYSAWPMVEPGVTPFQAKGIVVDEFLPLTIEDIRAHGVEQAQDSVRRARFAAALEALGAPASDLDTLMSLAVEGETRPMLDHPAFHHTPTLGQFARDGKWEQAWCFSAAEFPDQEQVLDYCAGAEELAFEVFYGEPFVGARASGTAAEVREFALRCLAAFVWLKDGSSCLHHILGADEAVESCGSVAYAEIGR